MRSTYVVAIAAAVITVVAAVVILSVFHVPSAQPARGEAVAVSPLGVRLTVLYEAVSVEDAAGKIGKILEAYEDLRSSGINISSVDIDPDKAVVLKVIINLTNDGEKIVYYKTNAYCAPYQPAMVNGQSIPPFTNEVSEPVSLPIVRVEEGSALPLTVVCTADLRYVPLTPGSSVTSEYYIVVSDDFRGSVGAVAEICSGLGTDCSVLNATAEIDLSP